MHITDELRDTVAALLRKGSDKFILPRYQTLTDNQIETKTSDTDFVTIADREMEYFLSDALPELVPDSWVLGEEAVSLHPELRDNISKGVVWCVDPVDGTRNFVQQNSAFCAMISLVQNNTPVASWIYTPLDDTCYFATIGKGCWQHKSEIWQKLALHNSDRKHPELIGTATIRGLDGDRREAVRQNLKAFSGRQFIGCAGVETILLITGMHDFLFHTRITPWDHAPVALFAQEAGLYVCFTPSGRKFEVDQAEPLLVAPYKNLWQQLEEAIWHNAI